MNLGIHTSISGGFDRGIKELNALGCNACQIFSRSPRGGKAKPISPDEGAHFRGVCEANGIDPVVVHIPYVLNLATPDPAMHEYAVQMVVEDMMRSDILGASYLVLHMGSHKDAGIENGLAQVAKALGKALEIYTGKTKLLLENTAGGGKEVGFKFEHLKWVLDELDSPMAGVCFDTCHGFAAGYDLSNQEKVHATIAELDEIVGLDKIHVIHTNDSMFPFASKKDRHANIGEGYIGKEGFSAIVNHPGLRNKTFILETPVVDENSWANNVNIIRDMLEK